MLVLPFGEFGRPLTQGAVLSTVSIVKLSVQAAANYSHSSSSSELHRRTLGPHRLSTTSGKESTDPETQA